MSDHEQENGSNVSNRRRQFPERVQDDDASFRINREGTGVVMNWKSVAAIILATTAVVAGYLDITETAKGHTATLAQHSEALAKLEGVTHDLNSKLDAVLWQAGINPKTVVRDAAAASAVPPHP